MEYNAELNGGSPDPAPPKVPLLQRDEMKKKQRRGWYSVVRFRLQCTSLEKREENWGDVVRGGEIRA